MSSPSSFLTKTTTDPRRRPLCTRRRRPFFDGGGGVLLQPTQRCMVLVIASNASHKIMRTECFQFDWIKSALYSHRVHALVRAFIVVVVSRARVCIHTHVGATNTASRRRRSRKKKRTEEEEVLLLLLRCVREISTARQSAVPSRHSERVRAIPIGVRTARDARLRRRRRRRVVDDETVVAPERGLPGRRRFGRVHRVPRTGHRSSRPRLSRCVCWSEGKR